MTVLSGLFKADGIKQRNDVPGFTEKRQKITKADKFCLHIQKMQYILKVVLHRLEVKQYDQMVFAF